MAATLAEINSKLDLTLAGIKEIEELREKQHLMEEMVVVIHRGRCNNKVYYCLSHDVVT